MDDQRRSYDIELAEINAKLAAGAERMGRIEHTGAEILKAINGNGGPGLLTRLALQESGLTRLWWWTGGMAVVVAAAALRIIVAGQK